VKAKEEFTIYSKTDSSPNGSGYLLTDACRVNGSEATGEYLGQKNQELIISDPNPKYLYSVATLCGSLGLVVTSQDVFASSGRQLSAAANLGIIPVSKKASYQID